MFCHGNAAVRGAPRSATGERQGGQGVIRPAAPLFLNGQEDRGSPRGFPGKASECPTRSIAAPELSVT
jgi:hypothetical protein